MRNFFKLLPVSICILFYSCDKKNNDDSLNFNDSVLQAVEKKDSLGELLDKRFWTNFHNGNYDSIDKLIEDHKVFFDKYPRDTTTYGFSKAFTSAHISWLSFWKASEMAIELPDDYNSNLNAQIKYGQNLIEYVDVAIEYFQNSFEKKPLPQITGFLSIAQALRSNLPFLSEERKQELLEGYTSNSITAIEQWPAFNLFTIYYPLSSAHYESIEFENAIEGFWLNLEACSGETIDRYQPDFKKTIQIIEQLVAGSDTQRACGNSLIAPYNTEGFLIIFADMLVKRGEVDLAKEVYSIIDNVTTFESWPYKHLPLEKLNNIKENMTKFRQLDVLGRQPSALVNSKISCAICHQKTGSIRSD